MLNPLPGEVVVDLGAGPGYYVTELLHRLGPTGRLLLVDIDAENLEMARRKAPSDSRVVVWVGSAARATDIPSGSAHRVLLSLVLCCLSDKAGALSQAWRILRPGGRLLVTFPRVGQRLRLRRRTLGLTRERWTFLMGALPWKQRPVRSGWFVRRFLLEKPAAQAAPADRAG
ncbi:MAG: class I SAM-dependent methyltransferase [Thermoplasmata archaeon]|nr:class I SAM-dependent methyltransferase [Thermoplasmata archaeon]MCI4359717.1 class I SAM-dependent methyltransferase [Thermoplasmata archaeon]